MSERRESNPRPQAWEACALPTELLSHIIYSQIYKEQNIPLHFILEYLRFIGQAVLFLNLSFIGN